MDTTHSAALDQLAPWLTGAAQDWTPRYGRATPPARAHALELAVRLSRPVPGHIVEFGVREGRSTRILRDELWRGRRWDPRQRGKRIYACDDSFESLPAADENAPQGEFAVAAPRLRAVRVVRGWVEKSLTPELAHEVGRVSLAHLDAELYESTACALDWLTPLLGAGSLLLFDEFLGEEPAASRAFLEWTDRTSVETALLAWFVSEPNGGGGTTDHRALFQVVGYARPHRAVPLLPARLLRRVPSPR